MGKQLVNFITCGCESSALFFVIYKAEHEPISSLRKWLVSYKDMVHIYIKVIFSYI
jgi:hypothetical protein